MRLSFFCVPLFVFLFLYRGSFWFIQWICLKCSKVFQSVLKCSKAFQLSDLDLIHTAQGHMTWNDLDLIVDLNDGFWLVERWKQWDWETFAAFFDVIFGDNSFDAGWFYLQEDIWQWLWIYMTVDNSWGINSSVLVTQDLVPHDVIFCVLWVESVSWRRPWSKKMEFEFIDEFLCFMQLQSNYQL